MEVQTWKIGDVHPYKNNPRNNTAAVKPVANSIKEFGFQQPIVVDKDGVIIVGHTRYKAAKMLKLKEVPVVVAANLTPDQVKAYRVADNSTGEVAVWDIPLLNAEIQSLDYDFADFGLNVAVQQVDGDAEDDDYDMELPEEPTCRVGDIWQLGNHRLMVGDSTDPRYVNALMGSEQADLLVTDPPYNVDYEGSNGKKNPERQYGRKPVPAISAPGILLRLRCLPHRRSRVHLPRRHRGRSLPCHVPGGRLGAARLPDLGQEQPGAGPRRLPVPARALPVWLEAGCRPLLHQ